MPFPSNTLVPNSVFNLNSVNQNLNIAINNEESELLPNQEAREASNASCASVCEKLATALCCVFGIAGIIGGALFVGVIANDAGAGPVLSGLLGFSFIFAVLCASAMPSNHASEGLSHAL